MHARTPAAALRGALALVLAAALAVLGGLGLAVLVAPGPAAAHDTLLRSSPADGEQLAAAPGEWTLEFSADLLLVGAEAIVLDERGQAVEHGDPVIDGPAVTIPLGALGEGSYTGHWRVVSSDGHPISGTVVFGVGVPAGAPVTGAASTQGAAGGQGQDGSTTSSPLQPEGLPGWALPLIGIVALVAAIGGGAAILGRGRREQLLDEVDPSNESDDQQ